MDKKKCITITGGPDPRIASQTDIYCPNIVLSFVSAWLLKKWYFKHYTRRQDISDTEDKATHRINTDNVR